MQGFYGWCAGIVDGEGHVGLIKSHNQRRPTVAVGNTDYRIVEILYHNFGGYISLQPKRENRLPCWVWFLKGKEVVLFLEKIQDCLVSKKEVVDIVLKYAYTINKKPIDRLYRNKLVKDLELAKKQRLNLN